MSIRVALTPEARRAVQLMDLPEVVVVEVLLRVQALRENPASRLVRADEPFDGMVLYFDFIDPANRLHQYHFIIHAVYSQDEETLIVVDAMCHRDFV